MRWAVFQRWESLRLSFQTESLECGEVNPVIDLFGWKGGAFWKICEESEYFSKLALEMNIYLQIVLIVIIY